VATLRGMNGADSNQIANRPTSSGLRMPDAARPGDGRTPEPLPPRPAANVPPQIPQLPQFVRKVKPSAWVELAFALPWLWWSVNCTIWG